jgi:foldase protein PrsA
MSFRAVVLAILMTFAVAAPAIGQATRPAGSESILDQLLADQPAGEGDVVARYDQAAVTRGQLMDFLLQTRGLDALLNLMQLQMAKALAANEGVVVTRADVEAEERSTLMQAFAGEEIGEDQYDELLTQLLAQQQLSRAEFDVVMATNAYLKALARPQIDRMLTDENLRKAFNIRYGEQVRVRHIQLENLAQVAEVRKRLDAGEEFAKVAAEVSRNADTRQVGGMFPPFSMQSDYPEPFRNAAFELEVGQVSDPVEAAGFFHLIKLEERIAPRAVVFEDVREELKKTVAEEQVLVVTTRLRRLLAQMLGSDNLKVLDPVLAEQLRLRLAQVRPQPTDAEGMKRQLESERPTTGPSTRPGSGKSE